MLFRLLSLSLKKKFIFFSGLIMWEKNCHIKVFFLRFACDFIFEFILILLHCITQTQIRTILRCFIIFIIIILIYSVIMGSEWMKSFALKTDQHLKIESSTLSPSTLFVCQDDGACQRLNCFIKTKNKTTKSNKKPLARKQNTRHKTDMQPINKQ